VIYSVGKPFCWVSSYFPVALRDKTNEVNEIKIKFNEIDGKLCVFCFTSTFKRGSRARKIKWEWEIGNVPVVYALFA